MRKALLLVNLGTPDKPTYFSVFRYLREFLTDGRVININPLLRFFLVTFIIVPFRSFGSSKLYKQLWTENGSPLLFHTKELANKLDHISDYDVYYAMRYQKPSLKKVIDKIMRSNPDEIIILPLFPHYAAATTGSVFQEVQKYISKYWVVPKITFINQFYDNKLFIQSWAEKAKKFDLDSFDKIIFSYHGIPNSHVDNVYFDSMCSDHDCEIAITDENKFCYKATCYETTRLLVNELEISSDKIVTSFQSRLTNKWLTPFTDEVLEDFSKNDVKKVLIFSPAFTADCLETIIELGVEYKEMFLEMGGEELEFVPSLNSSDSFVQALSDIVSKR